MAIKSEMPVTWADAQAAIKRLEESDLWDKTHHDWDIDISISLTEPVCPWVRIAPEFSDTNAYAGWGDSIEEAVVNLCNKLLADVQNDTIKLGNFKYPERKYPPVSGGFVSTSAESLDAPSEPDMKFTIPKEEFE